MNDGIYPNVPGWKADGTSKEAAVSVEPDAKVLEEMTYHTLCQYQMTADEVADYLNRDKLSIRPRVSTLKTKGKIYDTGTRRMNASGKRAAVWAAVVEQVQFSLF